MNRVVLSFMSNIKKWRTHIDEQTTQTRTHTNEHTNCSAWNDYVYVYMRPLASNKAFINKHFFQQHVTLCQRILAAYI